MIGIVPAAGAATRLGDLARGSKEVLRVYRSSEDSELRPAACCALEAMALAGVERARVVMRPEKRELKRALGHAISVRDASDRLREVRLEYQETEPTPSSVHTIAQALTDERARRSTIALAFPDILFRPRTALRAARELLERSEAVAVLACFEAERPEKTDMVEIDEEDRLRGVVIKQPDRGLRWTWQCAVWRPGFTQRLLDATGRGHRTVDDRDRSELHVGSLLQRALSEGETVLCVPIEGGRSLDIGTPEDLARAPEF